MAVKTSCPKRWWQRASFYARKHDRHRYLHDGTLDFALAIVIGSCGRSGIMGLVALGEGRGPAVQYSAVVKKQDFLSRQEVRVLLSLGR
jgi:hypothetical protein